MNYQSYFSQVYEQVIESGRYIGELEKVSAIAHLIYAKGRRRDKMECVWQALEWYEAMTGRLFDPTKEQLDDIVLSIT